MDTAFALGMPDCRPNRVQRPNPYRVSATLTLSDSGPGIDDGLRPRLLQAFGSGGNAGGAGLGLAICQEIVQSMGGHLVLDNRLAQGRVLGLDARVRLTLADNPAP